MWTIIRSDRSARTCRRRARRHAAAFLALSVALLAGPARAADDLPAAGPPAADSPLDSLRERFREGMDKYKAGAFADAILIWESIYRDLGSEKGYRLAFDLGRAYDALGDLIKAADHYESYLEKVRQRRSDGELLEANVERQEEVARDRLEKIASLKARIRVKAGLRQPVIVQIDNAPARVAGFTVYVEPGAHTVTFGAGKEADVRRLAVERGVVVDVEPRAESPSGPSMPAPSEPRFETRLEHPFSPLVLWVSAGVAVASLLVPAITYAHALSVKSDYDSPSTSTTDKLTLANDYESARTNAYASIVVPALFTAAAGGLAVWYVLGTREARIPIPTPSVTSTGAGVSVSARF
jgi:tetratricopeptide (TPR) repeat protein